MFPSVEGVHYMELLFCLSGELRNLVSILGRQSDNGISLEQVRLRGVVREWV